MSNICETVLQEHVYGCYFLEYTWVIYVLAFLTKTCSSGMQLTMNSDGNTLCTSQMFTFLSLPVGSETSSCLVTINLMTLNFDMYFASQSDFSSKFLIIIKSPILYCGMSLYLSLFCLEHASFVLSAAYIYVCLSLSKWVMPSSEPRYLGFGCKKAARWGKYGSYPKYKKWGDSCECSCGNQLNAAVAYGSSLPHLRVPSMENFWMQSLMNLCDDSNFLLASGCQGDM